MNCLVKDPCRNTLRACLLRSSTSWLKSGPRTTRCPEGAPRVSVTIVALRFTAAVRMRRGLLANPAPRKHIGKLVCNGAKRGIVEVLNPPVATDPSEGELAAATGQDVLVDGLMRHVKAAVRAGRPGSAARRDQETASALLLVV